MAVPSTSPDPMTKEALRRLARERRSKFVSTLSPDGRRALEAALAQHLKTLLPSAQVIGGYCPMADEISPLPALKWAQGRGATIAYPAFSDRDGPFRFLAGEPTETGPWPCRQPPLESPEVAPALLLVPLVAVDEAGTRIGQGKGHYDRVLAHRSEHLPLLIGVGWAVQRFATTFPRDSWDVPLDGFASPDGLEMFR